MTVSAKKTAQAPGICEPCINYAKMKNELNEGSPPLGATMPIQPTVSVDQHETSSRADGIHAHPVTSDEQSRTPETRVGKESARMTSDDWKALGFVFEASPDKTLKIDMSKYEDLFEDADLSDDQKQEIVLELWKIIIPFVNLGFKVSPLDLACGKLPETNDETGNQDSAMVSSEAETLTEKFNHLAAE